MNAREFLKAAYLDYLNNYLTYARWGEDNHMSEEAAREVIDLGHEFYRRDTDPDFGFHPKFTNPHR